jgi:hypothetical protein
MLRGVIGLFTDVDPESVPFAPIAKPAKELEVLDVVVTRSGYWIYVVDFAL